MSCLRWVGFAPLVLGLAALAQAQQSPEPINLVMPSGAGRIVLPSGPDTSLQMIAAYDDGQRPVAQFKQKDGTVVSYILFHNLSGDPSGKGCREDAIGPLLEHFGRAISNVKRNDPATGAGVFTVSYFIASVEGQPVRQQNLFGFFGDATTCAEVHISRTSYKPADEAMMEALLASAKPDLGYTPNGKDYFFLATILFRSAPAAAAPYYRSALAALPAGAGTLRPRRILTDQLAMSLGMGGNIKESRAVLEAAIASDPDYPMYYYELACADAENGDAANAKIHLEAAVARKKNVLSGETFPDPTKDDSLQKLKGDKAFWEYAQSVASSGGN